MFAAVFALTALLQVGGTLGYSDSRLRSIESLTRQQPSDSAPVVLRGVVTLVRGNALYVQDQTGAVAVYPQDPYPFALGAEVEVNGTYRAGTSAAVSNAVIRHLWSGSPPVPLALRPEEAAEGTYAYRLVEIEGELIKSHQTASYLILTLEGNRQVFTGSLRLSSPLSQRGELTKNLEDGSTLRLTGVCSPSASQGEENTSAFAILLRSTDDVRVVHPPPWWNLRNAVWVAGLALVLLMLFHRLRVRSLHLRFRAVVEERLRIAREMHDMMAQGFTGLTYQLDGLARELELSDVPGTTRRHLQVALELLRHSREEAHRSIFALRSLAQTEPDLINLLASSSESMLAGGDVTMRTVREGKPARLPDQLMSDFFRIGQEAITNAVRHGHASEISLAARWRDGHLLLEICDNGCGFDTNQALSVEAGHFGIVGMKERAKRVGAQLDIRSGPELGTVVAVCARIREPRTWRDIVGNLAKGQANAQ
jgi:signal transduction histidine kinase